MYSIKIDSPLTPRILDLYNMAIGDIGVVVGSIESISLKKLKPL